MKAMTLYTAPAAPAEPSGRRNRCASAPLEKQADGAHHQADLQEESGDIEGVPGSAESNRFRFPLPGTLDLTQLAVFLENPVLLPDRFRAKQDFLALLPVPDDVRFETGQQVAHLALGIGRDHSRIQQYPQEVALSLDQRLFDALRLIPLEGIGLLVVGDDFVVAILARPRSVIASTAARIASVRPQIISKVLDFSLSSLIVDLLSQSKREGLILSKNGHPVRPDRFRPARANPSRPLAGHLTVPGASRIVRKHGNELIIDLRYDVQARPEGNPNR